MKNEFSSFNCITSFESGHEISLNKKWFQLTYLQKTTLFSHEYKWQKKLIFPAELPRLQRRIKVQFCWYFIPGNEVNHQALNFGEKVKKKSQSSSYVLSLSFQSKSMKICFILFFTTDFIHMFSILLYRLACFNLWFRLITQIL